MPTPTRAQKPNQDTTNGVHSLQAVRHAAEHDGNVPQQLLETPKESLADILQDYATLEASFSLTTDSTFKCVLECSFPGGEQIARTVGLDRKRVCRIGVFTLCEADEMSRKMRKEPLTSN